MPRERYLAGDAAGVFFRDIAALSLRLFGRATDGVLSGCDGRFFKASDERRNLRLL